MISVQRYEVAIIGAGAAGLGLAVRLAAARLPGVVLVQSPVAAPERTWCSWQRRHVPWADAVAHRWPAAEVVGPDGARRRLDLAPYRYEMVRSRDFERWADARLTGVERVTAHVDAVEDGRDAARVLGDGLDLRATWVLDTRPAPPARPGRTALLQHFLGWTVRTASDAFDPSTASLMDFRLPQPAGGVAFGYVLPTSRREALVEHTVFSRTAWDDAEHEAGLHRYAEVVGLPGHEVLAVERGVIPMTDAPFPRRAGRRVFRLGAAGGATRPSTGYTFAAAQRQAGAVAKV
jgi:lycopene beta-cyclase